MKPGRHFFHAPLLVLALLFAFTASPLSAQNTLALSQTAEITSADGQVLTVRYPKGWVTETEENMLALASSRVALEQMQAGDITDPDGIGLIIYMPAMLDRLNLPRTTPPDETLAHFLEVAALVGEIQMIPDTTVPMAAGMVTLADDPDDGGFLAALGFPNGTVIAAAQPGEAVDATVFAILDSITLTDDATVISATPESETDTEATIISIARPDGDIDLSFVVPDGWSYEYSAGANIVTIGNSASALSQASQPEPEFEDGDIAITLGLPSILNAFGAVSSDSPKVVIQAFIDFADASGIIANDASFSVPAAQASVSGDLAVTADIYALQFPEGTLIIAVQPPGMIDDTVLALLHSVQYGEPTDTLEETATEEIRQWAIIASGSSEYSGESWSFEQATGEPNTPECGDNATAWAAATRTGQDTLVLEFEQAVIPTQINVHQSYNPGAIVMIDVGNTENRDQVLSLPNSADPPGNTPCPGVFSLDVSGVDEPIDFVVLYLDQSITENWNEIDAVELVGIPAE